MQKIYTKFNRKHIFEHRLMPGLRIEEKVDIEGTENMKLT